MIETADIYRSIRAVLEKEFPDILIQTKDIKTPVPPCFYVRFVTGVEQQTATEFVSEDCSFEVVYFAQYEALSELIEMKRRLRKVFNKPLKIELSETDATTGEVLASGVQYQEIDSVTFSLNEEDYVLNCTLSLVLNQGLNAGANGGTDVLNRYDEYDNEEYMEEIELETVI